MRKALLGKPTKWEYRFSAGFYLLNGKRTQKFFWLGHDTDDAEDKAIAISRLNQRDNATDPSGKKIWSDSALEKAHEIAKGDKEPAAQTSAPVVAQATLPEPIRTVPPKFDGLTLYQGIELYKTELKALLIDKTIGQRHYEDLLFRLKQLTDSTAYTPHPDTLRLGEKNTPVYVRDLPLAEIEQPQLDRMRRMFKQRPVSKDSGKPISIEYVSKLLGALRQLFF